MFVVMSNYEVELSNSRDSSTCVTDYPFSRSSTGFEPSISDYINRISDKYKDCGVSIKMRIYPKYIQLSFNF